MESRSDHIPNASVEPAQTTFFRYPYSYDPRRERHPLILSDEAASVISHIAGPVIEVGGPTVSGYRLLGDNAVLPSEPLITNHGFRNTLELDGTNMATVKDESVGMFLMSCIGDINNAAFEMSEPRKILPWKIEEQREKWRQIVVKEIRDVTADPTLKPQYNLVACIIKEMERTLKKEGVLLYQSITPDAIEYAKRLGFKVIQQENQYGDLPIFSCVLVK